MSDKRIGQSVSRLGERVYIYIYALIYVYIGLESYIYIVPTVFLGLNKLLLFGTKIVTLFGQRKNVFVKQKHSGQKFLNFKLTTLCGCRLFFSRVVMFVSNTEQKPCCLK